MIGKSDQNSFPAVDHSILGQPPSVKAGIIGLFGIFIGGIITHYQTKKREINARHFADKREGYLHMIDLLFDIIFSAKVGKELTEAEMIEKILPFNLEKSVEHRICIEFKVTRQGADQ